MDFGKTFVKSEAEEEKDENDREVVTPAPTTTRYVYIQTLTGESQFT